MKLTEQEQKELNKIIKKTIKTIDAYKKYKNQNGDYEEQTGVNLCWDLWNYEGDIKATIEKFRENHKGE